MIPGKVYILSCGSPFTSGGGSCAGAAGQSFAQQIDQQLVFGQRLADGGKGIVGRIAAEGDAAAAAVVVVVVVVLISAALRQRPLLLVLNAVAVLQEVLRAVVGGDDAAVVNGKSGMIAVDWSAAVVIKEEYPA